MFEELNRNIKSIIKHILEDLKISEQGNSFKKLPWDSNQQPGKIKMKKACKEFEIILNMEKLSKCFK